MSVSCKLLFIAESTGDQTKRPARPFPHEGSSTIGRRLLGVLSIASIMTI